jgi:hypothetical protein
MTDKGFRMGNCRPVLLDVWSSQNSRSPVMVHTSLSTCQVGGRSGYAA